MSLLRRAGALVAGLLLGVLLASQALAQTYPNRPIKLIAPFPAGGLADVLARLVGDELSKSLGQPVIVENRAGAGGNTGADAVAKADPDGYTLLMSSAGILTANQFLYAKMPFDPETAFVPISIAADMSMLVVVNPNVEAKTLGEFVALARSKPDKINFGSPGVGTTGHLGLAMFMHAAGIRLTHVPYRGAAPAVNDLIAGQIDGVVDNPPTVLAHIQAGKLRPLAVAAGKRLPQLPDVPTVQEALGFPFSINTWYAAYAPKGTPRPIVDKLNAAFNKVLKEPEVKKWAEDRAIELIQDSTPASAKKFYDDQMAFWDPIIKQSGAKPE
jgi:tripartite-type tricarboxylate transporter receptor subunit TctC